MAVGSISNYQGGTGVVDLIEDGFDTFVKVFNDTGGTLTNGDVVKVEYLKDTTTTNGTNQPTVVTPATTSVAVVIGVVNNKLLKSATIADDDWGYVQIRGYCEAITKTTTANPVAIDDYLKAMDGVKTAATDGTSAATSWSAKSFALAKSAKISGVSGTVTGFLFGREVTV